MHATLYTHMKNILVFQNLHKFVLPYNNKLICTHFFHRFRSVYIYTNITNPLDNVFCHVHFSGNSTALVHSKYRIRDYHQKNTENLFNSFAQTWTWRRGKISEQKKQKKKKREKRFRKTFLVFASYFPLDFSRMIKNLLEIFASKQLFLIFFFFLSFLHSSNL